MDNSKLVLIIALAAYGKGISGGDRIYIEFARRWSKRFKVCVFVWEEGYEMCKRQQLDKSLVKFKISKLKKWSILGFVINYFVRIIEGIRLGLITKLTDNGTSTIVYSSSEFLMDVIPVFILKIRYPKLNWVASWYQTAPSPLVGFRIGNRKDKYRTSALIYWLSQRFTMPFIKLLSDFVLVNNDNEKNFFPKHNKKGKVVVVLGAVDTENICYWIEKNKKLPKTYDAVFQGRFHAQKGVVELISVWKKVVKNIPNATLAMIGDGPLMENVKRKIQELNLANNIKLFGYVFDGDQKYKIFSQSKIVVHPAFFDSGGMAAAEAMAFSLPCIGFNLPSYKYYYPKGMVKIKKYDIDAFAKTVTNLLENNDERMKIGKEAHDLVINNMSWNRRSEEIIDAIITKIK
ncbi:MAG: Glycosyltransferase [Microgenomates group bacterium GW2011_GWC1_37_12b]|nr:MAG: Glycosyltransferase [Microgenomates group bacterium GW2011_GWC1_37_12b]